MNRRDEQIAQIIARTASLDPKRLSSFYEQVREAYWHTSIIDRIALVVELADRTPSDFRVLNNQELRRIEHFNGGSYIWEMYCKELGHSVALGEEAYLFEVFQEQVPDVGVSSGVGFEGIHRVIDSLVTDGYRPDVLFAPIAYMVGLLGEHTAPIEWEDGRPYFRSAHGLLEVFWSSASRPLDRFIVGDHRAGTWYVKLDPHVGGRLTVAIGEQVTPVRGVVWLAETVAKYEISDLRAFRSFRPDVKPDRDFPTVR